MANKKNDSANVSNVNPIPYLVRDSSGRVCRPVKVKTYAIEFQSFDGDKRMESFTVDVRKAFTATPAPSVCKAIFARQTALQKETNKMWAPNPATAAIYNIRAAVPVSMFSLFDIVAQDDEGKWVCIPRTQDEDEDANEDEDILIDEDEDEDEN